MAATYRVRLIQGPCAGTTKRLSQAEWDAGETTCKGEVYVFDGVKRPSGQLPHFTFRPGVPAGPTGDGGTGAGVAPQAHQGWSGLRQSINQELPAALRRANRYQQAALRELAHRRRVGG
jgi:hypothetical protein